jgi:hypothetical protein
MSALLPSPRPASELPLLNRLRSVAMVDKLRLFRTWRRRHPVSDTEPSIDELLVEWRDLWLPNIKSQIMMIHHRRQVHDEFIDMLNRQGHPEAGIFRDNFHFQYIDSQVMAVRRQCDRDKHKGPISLYRLIGQLVEHRGLFTRPWYLNLFASLRPPAELDEPEGEAGAWIDVDFLPQLTDDTFNMFADSPKAKTLSRRILMRDHTTLIQTSQKVVDFANAVVAHNQHPTQPEVQVTYNEFHAAIDLLGEMLGRYCQLIAGAGPLFVTPVIQNDWKAPFQQPLI